MQYSQRSMIKIKTETKLEILTKWKTAVNSRWVNFEHNGVKINTISPQNQASKLNNQISNSAG